MNGDNRKWMENEENEGNMDYSLLLNRLKVSFGIDGPVLNWISSYLSNRTQFIQLSQSKSTISPCTTGVSQSIPEYPRALFLNLSYSLYSSLLYLLLPPFTKCPNSNMLTTPSFSLPCHGLTLTPPLLLSKLLSCLIVLL